MKKEKNTIYTQTNIFDLAPEFLKRNNKYATILRVLDKLFIKFITLNIEYIRYFERINTMKEEELDLLAEELDVDFYDFNLNIEDKRELCKIAFETQSIKGTPRAITNIIDVFYKKGNILEFVDYNGNPGNFKIELQGIANEEALKVMLDRVNYVKKHSQHLDGIRFKSTFEIPLSSKLELIQHVHNKILPGTPSLNLGNIQLEAVTGNFIFINNKEGK